MSTNMQDYDTHACKGNNLQDKKLFLNISVSVFNEKSFTEEQELY